LPETRHILIALPTASQLMKSATSVAVANAALSLERHGIRVDLHNIDSADIVTARDMFANMVLHSDRFTDLLFVDSDMHFEPDVILKLASHPGQVRAVAYTRRSLDLGLLAEKSVELGNVAKAAAFASDFTFKPSWEGSEAPIEVSDGFCSAAAVGMGCALISRSALVGMVEGGVVQPRLDLHAGPNRTCWSFFAPIDLEGQLLSEDYAFCYRWTMLVKQILWVCIDEAIGHIGSFEYRARYIDRLSG